MKNAVRGSLTPEEEEECHVLAQNRAYADTVKLRHLDEFKAQRFGDALRHNTNVSYLEILYMEKMTNWEDANHSLCYFLEHNVSLRELSLSFLEKSDTLYYLMRSTSCNLTLIQLDLESVNMTTEALQAILASKSVEVLHTKFVDFTGLPKDFVENKSLKSISIAHAYFTNEETVWQQLGKCVNLEEIFIFSDVCNHEESLNAFANMFQKSNIRLLDLTCKWHFDSPPRDGSIISAILRAKTPQSKLHTIQTRVDLEDLEYPENFQEMVAPLQQRNNVPLGLLQLRLDSRSTNRVPDSLLAIIPSLLGLQNLQFLFLATESVENVQSLSEKCAQNLVLKNVTMITPEVPSASSLCVTSCERNTFLSLMAPILTLDAMDRLIKTALEWESKQNVLYHFLLSFWVS